MIVGGLDPGKKGYLAAISTETLKPTLYKIPYDDKGELNVPLFKAALLACDVVFCERPIAKNTEGMSTRLTDFGEIKGVIKSMDKRIVTMMPNVWKAAYGLNRNKKKSIELAKKKYPDLNLIPEGCRVENDDMAEAVLIAHYGLKQIEVAEAS
jgi:hypothetical protein